MAEVKDICCLPSLSKAAKLLSAYHWNKERLLADFFSGLTNLEDTEMDEDDEQEDDNSVGPEWESTERDNVECPICMEDTVRSATHALSCGHRYCEDCWARYLTVCFQI